MGISTNEILGSKPKFYYHYFLFCCSVLISSLFYKECIVSICGFTTVPFVFRVRVETENCFIFAMKCKYKHRRVVPVCSKSNKKGSCKVV